MSSAGTADAEGHSIRYAWDFGDGGTSTSTNPNRTYAAAGTYTITLNASDAWGRAAEPVTREVTLP